jgi:hypothetical protein
MELIKNSELIVSESKDNNQHTIILKRENPSSYNGITRLGDALNFLPAGIVNKDDTGMGATTLELSTKRHSIIVEPIKVTASSKAHRHNALYVGSVTNLHPQRIDNNDIQNYLKNDNILYKKIVVVADSLKRVMKVGGQDIFDNFFLLLDEVDSFQLDSSYRNSMEECIDYFKNFPANKRTMLTATMLKFSDPYFNNENITILKYDNPTKRNINLIKADENKIIDCTAKKIIQILQTAQQHKLLVAYNSITGCLLLANTLVNKNIVTSEEIAILCSQNSKYKVENFYNQLQEEKLPKKVNFITSAYFTGFDLHERFHLVSVSSNKSIIHSLSDLKLKQIAGRARDGLLSETIIYDLVAEEPKLITKDELIEIGKKQIQSLVCIRSQFKDNWHFAKTHEKIRSAIISTLDNENIRYVKDLDTNREPEISYLNIDAKLEMNRSQRELYVNENSLFEKLHQDGHFIQWESLPEYNTVSTVPRSTIQDCINKIDELINFLINVEHYTEVLEMRENNITEYNAIQKKILELYLEFFPLLDINDFLQKIREDAKKRDSRALNNKILSALVFTLSDNDPFKSKIKIYFPPGNEFTKTQLLERWNNLFIEINFQKRIDSEVSIVRITKSILQCKKVRRDGNMKFKIEGINPFEFKLKNQRLHPLTQEMIWSNISKYF